MASEFKNTIYILHLEPLEERYTKQWYVWFKNYLKNNNISFRFINGKTLTKEVETGVVLDVEGTNFWKFSQMMTICKLFKKKMIQKGDIFFTMDLWHPSLEAIPYIATLENIPIKLFGFLHAGSYTTEDFAFPMNPWARYFEKGWAKICNGIFVGSKYHKNKFTRLRVSKEIAKKIYVTGNPFNTKEIINIVGEKNIMDVFKRKNIIIFPHRWDIEKRPNIFVDLINHLWKQRQDFKVVITTSRKEFRSNQPWLIKKLSFSKFPHEIKSGLTKGQYYKELSKAKVFVSTTIEENFGYCLLEAITLGCSVVVPNKFSHKEILKNDDRFLYRNLPHAVKMISDMLDNPKSAFCYSERYNSSIEKMVKIMIKD